MQRKAKFELQSVITKTSAFFVKLEERRWHAGHHQRQDMVFSGRNIHVLHCKTAHIASQNMAFHTATCGILQCNMPYFSLRNAVFCIKKDYIRCTHTALYPQPSDTPRLIPAHVSLPFLRSPGFLFANSAVFWGYGKSRRKRKDANRNTKQTTAAPFPMQFVLIALHLLYINVGVYELYKPPLPIL